MVPGPIELKPAATHRLAILPSAASRSCRTPRGVMQRDLVERARRGDHDAFAALAAAAISRLDARRLARCSGIRIWRWTRSRTRSSARGAICPRFATRIASMPGCTACWSTPASTRRAGRDAIASTSTSPRSFEPAVGDASSTIADRDELERGFVRLGPEERAVIVLHHFLDLPLPEVAVALGIPLGTAKSRLYRALGDARGARCRRTSPGPRSRKYNRHEAHELRLPGRVSDWIHEYAGAPRARAPRAGPRRRRAGDASGRHGRSSKGGSPWT